MSDNKPSNWSLYKRMWPYMKPYWWMYLLAMLCAPPTTLLTVYQPILLKRAIDDHIRVGDIAGVQSVALWYLGALLASFVLQVGFSVLMSYAALRTITRLREGVYRHTMALKQSFYDVRPTGQLLTRATNDIESLGETLTAGAVTIVLDVLLIIGILVAMFFYEPRLTLVLLCMAPVIAIILDRLRRVLRRLYLEIRESLSAVNAYLAERLQGVAVVQLYSDEARSNAEFTSRVDRYRDATVRSNIWDALIYAIMDGLTSVSVGLILWAGTGAVLAEPMNPGVLVAFVDFVGKLFRPIQEFSGKLSILQRAASALEKIFGLLDEKAFIEDGDASLATVEGHLVLKNVQFAYRDGSKVLHGIDLELHAGEVVALVGRTGSGKTTIGKLLTRAYDGYTGSITLDGVELSDLSKAAVRRSIGMVRQDVQLFPGDVRFNLALGADLTDDALMAAVDVANAGPAVEALGGLDGRVAHKGSNLSVGEAQLLSFARTIAHNPPLVILDEATASVDTMTEARIQAATDAILARKTVLVIAHRLSTIVGSDRIVVLDAGRVIEVGSHAELLEADGVYAELYQQQFAEPGEQIA